MKLLAAVLLALPLFVATSRADDDWREESNSHGVLIQSRLAIRKLFEAVRARVKDVNSNTSR